MKGGREDLPSANRNHLSDASGFWDSDPWVPSGLSCRVEPSSKVRIRPVIHSYRRNIELSARILLCSVGDKRLPSPILVRNNFVSAFRPPNRETRTASEYPKVRTRG